MNKPPPGSDAAISMGCKCPVVDNSRGRGYMGMAGVYVHSGVCKVHSQDFHKLSQSLAASEKPALGNREKGEG